MQTLTPTPRWPLYEKRCRDWAAALKQIDGEFRRDFFGDFLTGFQVTAGVGAGGWILYETLIEPARVFFPPENWLLPTLSVVLLAVSILLGKKAFGVHYRFGQGEVSEVSALGRVRWREPLATLQTVSFPWRGRHAPQMLWLHWTTHRRAIELFPALQDAVAEVLAAARPASAVAPPEKVWRCAQCRESNPEGFEICWQCAYEAKSRVR